MIRSIWLASFLLTAPRVAAQTVVKTEPRLDSAQAELRDALVVLRDSLLAVNGAAVRLQRDTRQASNASLLSRARVMREACAGSGKALGPTRNEVRATPVPSRHIKARRELMSVLDRLESALTRCEADFAAMSEDSQAETVRGYAYDRSMRIQRVLQDYQVALLRFLDVVRIELPASGESPPKATGLRSDVDSHVHILWMEGGSAHVL